VLANSAGESYRKYGILSTTDGLPLWKVHMYVGHPPNASKTKASKHDDHPSWTRQVRPGAQMNKHTCCIHVYAPAFRLLHMPGQPSKHTSLNHKLDIHLHFQQPLTIYSPPTTLQVACMAWHGMMQYVSLPHSRPMPTVPAIYAAAEAYRSLWTHALANTSI